MTESTTSAPDPAAVDTLSYEQAREELVAVVARLEAGGVSLEESLALWERGEALADRRESWLEGAKVRLVPPGTGPRDSSARISDPADPIDQMTTRPDGDVVAATYDLVAQRWSTAQPVPGPRR